MKAKTSIKKALSLIVVLVMLLTMIPVGMISVGAEEATIDLSNYETETEFVIMNTADWLLIAESGKDFADKMVKLGADIDAGGFTTKDESGKVNVLNPGRFEPTTGENMPARPDGKRPSSGIEICRDEYAATFPTLFKEFAGVFDGQGYTIKNARVEEGLIAATTLDGAKIQNVNIVDCQSCDFYDYFDYGLVVGIASGSLTMDRINIVRGLVPANTFNTLYFDCGGGLVGLAEAAEGIDDALLKITNCNVDCDVHTGGEHNAIVRTPSGTGIVVGTVGRNFDFQMENCVISGSSKSYAGFIGAIGLLNVGENRTCVINNVTCDGVNIHATRPSLTHGIMSVGSLIGLLSPYSGAYIEIDKINVINGTVRTAAASAGGVIGGVQSYKTNGTSNFAKADAPVVGAELNISNVYSDTIVYGHDTYDGRNASFHGGFIGQLGEGGTNDDLGGCIFRGDVNLYNLYIGGSVFVESASYAEGVFTPREGGYLDSNHGGLFGVIGLATAEIYVSDAVVDVSFPYNPQFVEIEGDYASKTKEEKVTIGTEQLNCFGVISYGGNQRLKAAQAEFDASVDARYQRSAGTSGTFYPMYLHVSDVVTTVQGDFYAVVQQNRKGGLIYNETSIANGDKGALNDGANKAYVDEGIAQVRPAVAKQMVQYDENGFIEAISGAIANASNVQIVKKADNTADVRFIALTYVDNATGSATVTFKNAEGAEVKKFTFADVALNGSLTAVDGTEIAAYTTKEFGAKNFMAVTVKNVPLTQKYEVVWTFAYETAGVTVEGNTLTAILDTDGSIK